MVSASIFEVLKYMSDPDFRGIFTPASMFNDLGFTLTPDSMESFQTAIVPLLLGAFLIIIGNTGFPCMLRLVIYISSKLVRHESGVWEEFKFLLDHPRRCFTLLFPNSATWWLFWILVVLNGLDIIFFIVLDVSFWKNLITIKANVQYSYMIPCLPASIHRVTGCLMGCFKRRVRVRPASHPSIWQCFILESRFRT